MRKNILVVHTLLLIAAFLYSASTFDLKVIHRVMTVYNQEVSFNYYEAEISIIDRELISDVEISEHIDYLGDKYNLNISKLTYNFSGASEQPDSVLYYSSNSQYLEKRIFVEKENFKIGERYSTFPSDIEKKIPQFFSDNHACVYPLSSDNQPGGIYVLLNIEGDYEENVSNFTDELLEKYGEGMIFRSQKTGLRNTDSDDMTYFLTAKKEKLAICMFLVLLLTLVVFIQRKKISLMKLEGLSSLKVFFNFYLKDFLVIGAITYVAILAVSFFLFGLDTLSFNYFSKVWIIQYSILFALSIAISFIILFVIDSIPISESIKGQANLKELQYIATFAKIIVCLLLIPSVSTGLDSIMEIASLKLREHEIKEKANKYYSFGQVRISNYHGEIGTDKALALYKDIIRNYDIFEVSSGFIPLDEEFQNMLHVTFIDELFIKNNNLKYDSFDKLIVYFHESDNIDQNRYIEAISTEFNFKEHEIDIRYYDFKIPSIGFNSLRKSDYISNKTLLFIPVEEQYKGQFSSKVIYYEKGQVNLQKEIDEKFISHGFNPTFTISSIKSANQKAYKSVITYFTKEAKPFLVLTSIYLLVCLFMIQVHKASNKSLYFITRCEGVSQLYVKEYIVSMIVPVILALIISLMNQKLNIEVVAFFLVSEVIVFTVTNRIMKKRFWRK